MKQLRTEKIKVTITLKTGLHIGVGDTAIEIGGIDAPVMRDGNDYPYIPGSSLKGVWRALVETHAGLVAEDGGPHRFHGTACKDCVVCKAFGVAGLRSRKEYDKEREQTDDMAWKSKNDKEKKEAYQAWLRGVEQALADMGPTRLIVRDMSLSENDRVAMDDANERGENLLEEKVEIQMNRRTGTSTSGLRTIERVPPGTVFAGEILFRVFEADEDTSGGVLMIKELFGVPDAGRVYHGGILKRYLEEDYLGGMGTRGSGQVEVVFTSCS